MDVLARLTLPLAGISKQIELCLGDLIRPAPDQAGDLLVVSAFRDCYAPSPGTLIGALDQAGVSVGELARDKELDLRETCSCWLSKEITPRPPDVPYRRVLCFEPAGDGRPAERVGDIFRSLVPALATDPSLTRVAMPLVCTGVRGQAVMDMLPPLLQAAVEWMRRGCPLQTLRVVLHDRAAAAEAIAALRSLRQRAAGAAALASGPAAAEELHSLLARFQIDEAAAERLPVPARRGWLGRLGKWLGAGLGGRGRSESPIRPPAAAKPPDAAVQSSPPPAPPSAAAIPAAAGPDRGADPAGVKYDVFISYCQKDMEPVRLLVEDVRRARPDARVFRDQVCLQPGQSWQKEIFEAIEHTRIFVPFYSPNYLSSKVCQEEYNVARVCAMDRDGLTLFPIYLYSARLPAYMRILQYLDCTEADGEKLRAAAAALAAQV
jgi:hypothetical protein